MIIIELPAIRLSLPRSPQSPVISWSAFKICHNHFCLHLLGSWSTQHESNYFFFKWWQAPPTHCIYISGISLLECMSFNALHYTSTCHYLKHKNCYIYLLLSTYLPPLLLSPTIITPTIWDWSGKGNCFHHHHREREARKGVEGWRGEEGVKLKQEIYFAGEESDKQ